MIERLRIAELDALHVALTSSSRATFFRRIPATVRSRLGKHVSHASVVLEEDITGRDEAGRVQVLEETNPVFDDIMAQALSFAERHMR